MMVSPSPRTIRVGCPGGIPEAPIIDMAMTEKQSAVALLVTTLAAAVSYADTGSPAGFGVPAILLLLFVVGTPPSEERDRR